MTPESPIRHRLETQPAVGPSTEARHEYLASLFDLDGRAFAVTGGGSGIGLRMGTSLARAGARIHLLDVSEENLTKVASHLAADGLSVTTRVIDVTDHDSVFTALEEVSRRPEGLHGVFANAGITAGVGPRMESGRITAIDPEHWNRVLGVNLTGAMNTVSAAATYINGPAGRIVVTSSLGGVRADPLVGYAYAASKSAVIAMVRNASLELAQRDITVNALAPGIFETNIRRANPVAQSLTDDFKRITALKRSGRLEELEGLVLYLASTASSFMTGATLNLDGGGQHVGPNEVAQ